MVGRGPDGLNSWIVAIACCYIHMVIYGISRLSGVMFVASMTRYHVKRNVASLPYTINSFTAHIISPLVGFISHKLGIRLVATLGCILAAAGSAACFLAESISVVTLLWGVVNGLGLVCSVSLLPVAINQYFYKKRGIASGISYSGISIGSFIMPPIMEILLDNYGLSITFLFLASFMLSCVPAALMLKKPDFDVPQIEKQHERKSLISAKPKLYCEERADSLEDSGSDNVTQTHKSCPNLLACEIVSIYNGHAKTISASSGNVCAQGHLNVGGQQREWSDSKTNNLSLVIDPLADMNKNNDNDKHNRQIGIQNTTSLNIGPHTQYSEFKTSDDNQFLPHTSVENVSVKHFKKKQDVELNTDNKFREPSIGIYKNNSDSSNVSTTSAKLNKMESASHQIPKKMTDEDYRGHGCLDDKTSTSLIGVTKDQPKMDALEEKKTFLSMLSVLKDPVFVLLIITVSLYMFTLACLFTIIVDFAVDLGVEEKYRKYVLMSIGVGELVARLGFGWIADTHCITRTELMALSFLSQGFALLGLGLSSGFYMLIGILVLYGILHAGVKLVFPLIVADFIDEDKQTIAITSSGFLTGPLDLTISPLIGYFREELGSYKYIFYGLFAISLLCGFLFLLAPCISTKIREKGSSRKLNNIQRLPN